MSSTRRNLLFAIFALTAGGGGFTLSRFLHSQNSPTNPERASLLDLSLPDLQGRPQNLGQWPGRTLLFNFWATWCEPCREEIPLLTRMQQKFGPKNLQIVGISIDSVDKVQQFAKQFDINYPLMVAGFEVVELMRKLGNSSGSLPYSIILNPAGAIISTHLGGYTPTQLEAQLQSIMNSR